MRPDVAPWPVAAPLLAVAKLLHYRDRKHILGQVRQRGEILERALFLDAKKHLQEMGIIYAMLLPARLRGTYKNEEHFFILPILDLGLD
ncbi:hypothetical protein NDU88_000314 [Pleurodeles waltl]|uniref:Uncharacterized protein n=1 Tax=Pleurodeles waltl TaxID=8319 RepID=A0AAV7TEL1_PLEWA|nr:hypothetical protein NDU88_000314 [Pleurodeles waltl]